MYLLLLLSIALGFLASSSAEAEELEGTANYAYAIFVGTGKYTVSDRTIYIIRAPMNFTFREADYSTGRIGLKLLVPVAAGFTNFDEIPEIPDLSIDDLQTMSIAPGLEAQIPVKENWLISPFGQVGVGWDFKSSNNSFIWGTGARSRAWFGDNQKLLLGGEFLWAGNNPKSESEATTSFARLALGGEYKWQTDWAPFGRRVSWHGRLIHWMYTNAVEIEPPREKTEIDNTTEVGISFGIDPPINMLGYKFRQAGIGYEWSDQLTAVKFFTTFPF